MRAAVTGANGFIGRNLVKGLIQEGHEAVSIIRRSSKAAMLEELGSEVRVLGLQQLGELRAALEGVDTLFHLANLMVFATRSQQWEVNVERTRGLLRAAMEAGVKRLVYASSIAVYGDTGGSWVTEEGPCRPVTHYGRTKVAVEGLLRSLSDQLEWCALRPGVVYGPGSPLLYHMIRRGPVLMGDGSNWVPFVHVVDAVRAFITAAEEAEPGSIFNLVDDHPIRLMEFLEALARASRSGIRRFPYGVAYLLAVLEEARASMTGRVPRLTRDALHLYRTSVRVTNDRIKDRLGLRLRYPDPARALPDALENVRQLYAL